jgi:hypothetical protein
MVSVSVGCIVSAWVWVGSVLAWVAAVVPAWFPTSVVEVGVAVGGLMMEVDSAVSSLEQASRSCASATAPPIKPAVRKKSFRLKGLFGCDSMPLST